ncbi:MAG TPA: diphthamide biosynthesis enzyme Dph2 [Methanocorpusculum sp.]|nr:diphthamide biosynthesis enzyme Dph2 [Methanocorpusculum sp.]
MIPYTEIVDELKRRGVSRAALQVPEGLKRFVPELVSVLKKEGISAIVSGDPCWGACDLATDAAAGCDILVHIGHTPVTPEQNVLYIPYRKDIDGIPLTRAAETLKRYPSVSVTTTIQHAHQIEEIAASLRGLGVNAVIGSGSPRTPEPGQVLGCTYASARNARADANLFIGTGVFHAIGVALATKKPTFALDPFGSGDLQEISADPLLRRRFVQIEKAKKAQNFGILLSSKSGQARRDLAEHLATLHENAVIIMIREVSEMQLRNFGFDAYVNTACPRLAMDDQTRFPVPVLSPAEFEIVLGLRDWDDYVIDEIE